VVQINDAGHHPFLTYPAQFTKAFGDFLIAVAYGVA
jgi:pimeloyl-ACP methyl ester carboxylesterase